MDACEIEGWVVVGDRALGRVEDFEGDGERGAVLDSARWPSGLVDWFINPGFTPGAQATIVGAMAALDAISPLTFVQGSGPNPSAGNANIAFHPSVGACFSGWGFAYGWFEQPVFLSPNCANNAATVQHEVMHRLGLYHEQQREDRDDWLQVEWGEFDGPGWEANYWIEVGGPSTDWGKFDWASNMLYGSMGGAVGAWPVALRRGAYTTLLSPQGASLTTFAPPTSAVALPAAFAGTFVPWATDLPDLFGDESRFLDFGCANAGLGCWRGRTDVFRRRLDGSVWIWEIAFAEDASGGSGGGLGAPVPNPTFEVVATSADPSETLEDLLFGDFNGDEETDVLRWGAPNRYEVRWSARGPWTPFVNGGAPTSDISHLRAAPLFGNGCDQVVWDGEGGTPLVYPAPCDVPSAPTDGPDHLGPGAPTVPSSESWIPMPLVGGLGLSFSTPGPQTEFREFVPPVATGEHPRADLIILSPNSWQVHANVGLPDGTPSFPGFVEAMPTLQGTDPLDWIHLGDFDGDGSTDLLYRVGAADAVACGFLPADNGEAWAVSAWLPASSLFAPPVPVRCGGNQNNAGHISVEHLSQAIPGRWNTAGATYAWDLLFEGLYSSSNSLSPGDTYDLQRVFSDLWEVALLQPTPLASPKLTPWQVAAFEELPPAECQFGDLDADGQPDAAWWNAPPVVGGGGQSWFQELWLALSSSQTLGSRLSWAPLPGTALDLDPLDYQQFAVGNFLPDPAGASDTLIRVWVGGSPSYRIFPGPGGPPVDVAGALVPVRDLLIGDFDGDGLDDLLRADTAATLGTWFMLRSDATGNWGSWDLVCVDCLGHTREHLAAGNFDGDGADEVFSDAEVPTRSRWMAYDIRPDLGNNWIELGEAGLMFPDIAVGQFGFDPGGWSDVLRVDADRLEVSPAADGTWTQIGTTSAPISDFVVFDFDFDGFADLLRFAPRWL